MDQDKQAEAEEVERRAQELHDQEYDRLCEQHVDELNAEADRLRSEAEAEYGER